MLIWGDEDEKGCWAWDAGVISKGWDEKGCE